MRVAPIYRHDALHSGLDDKFATDQRDIQGVPKKVIIRENSWAKLSAVGQNFPMDMTLKRLVRNDQQKLTMMAALIASGWH